jgi:hypothetical protein
MEPRNNRDFQTVSLFTILALLTALFVLGIRAVLFAPGSEVLKNRLPAIEAEKTPGP